MKYFIFLTIEGFTQTPDNEDIDNCQLIGYGIGNDAEEAFKHLIKENKYLKLTTFNEVYCLELVSMEKKTFHIDSIR